MNLSTIIGAGKTFGGGVLLILGGVLAYFGVLPDSVHFDLSPLEAISAGLVAIGIGAKLQKLIVLLK